MIWNIVIIALALCTLFSAARDSSEERGETLGFFIATCATVMIFAIWKSS